MDNSFYHIYDKWHWTDLWRYEFSLLTWDWVLYGLCAFVLIMAWPTIWVWYRKELR